MELQERQGEFQERGAVLVVLGAGPESREFTVQQAAARGITYPLLYDEGTDVVRSLDLWSDQMDMPFMGYVIIDASGRIVAHEQVLSEAPGSGTSNADQILAALDRAQASTAP